MKKIIILNIVAFTAIPVFSQHADTMSLTIGGETISLPVPKTGNKTTINLEDSSSVIQISIGKSSKISPLAGTLKSPGQPAKNKQVSWFGQADIGFSTMVNRKPLNMPDTVYEGNMFGSSGNNRVYMVNMAPKTIYPGFNIGFAIREKRRQIGKSEIWFVTGTRFRYSRFGYKGVYDVKEVKVETSNGNTVIYPDSVYSVKTGTYKAAVNSYELLMPFVFETHLKKHPDVVISAGINLAISLMSTRTSEEVTGPYASSFFSRQQNMNINLQPLVRVCYKRTGVFVSLDPNRMKLGYGSPKAVRGNLLHLGLCYKLY